ncbi:hypothetical protein ACHQM5_017374 [Ranunculus cassubicifolius]
MLAIFEKKIGHPPQELSSPSSRGGGGSITKKSKFPNEILKNFVTSHGDNAFSMSFSKSAVLAYAKPQLSYSIHQRLFCGLDDIYCLFLGTLNNLCSLSKQYGLSKGTNDAMFVIEAYRTLRDRGPYPADQVVKDLEGSFAFVIYDQKAQTVFTALSSDGRIKLFWGLAADGSVVISDDVEVIKESCAKSFAPFPNGCMFHSEGGLLSYEHPTNKMKAMPRIDSEGVMCGSNFKVDTYSRMNSIPRVGSEANWVEWSSSQ